MDRKESSSSESQSSNSPHSSATAEELECPRAPQRKPISLVRSKVLEELREQFRISPEDPGQEMPHFPSQPCLEGSSRLKISFVDFLELKRIKNIRKQSL